MTSIKEETKLEEEARVYGCQFQMSAQEALTKKMAFEEKSD